MPTTVRSIDGLHTGSEAFGLRLMPCHPLRPQPFIDEKICPCFVALLHRNAPSQGVLVNLAITQDVLRLAVDRLTTSRNEARVTGTPSVHEECTRAVPQHADARTIRALRQPEFELRDPVVLIERQAERLNRLDMFLITVEENRDHLRCLTFDMRGMRQQAKHDVACPSIEGLSATLTLAQT